MTQDEFEHKLQRARAQESEGNLAAARAIYESMLQAGQRPVMAQLLLSELEQRAGRYRAANAHAHNAAEALRTSQRWDALPFVTMRLLAFDERDAVRDLIAAADWSHRSVLSNSPTLSQHLWLIDEYEAALRLIEAASQRVQPNHLLSYSRANALRYCGRMDEATAEFEKCIALAPNYPYGHWSLAYHAKADPLGSRIDRIRKALAAVSSDPIAQAHLHYALFKELDDLGDVDAAWRELQAGARSMRQLLAYDGEREERALIALQQLTDTSFVKSGVAKSDSKTPIFVVGMPRTGTTVLERILSNHSLVGSAGELNDFSRVLSWEADHFYDVPASSQSLDRVKDVDFARVGEAYLQRTAGRYGSSGYLIDKNPANFFNVGFIAKALPQAKIICLRRNPMDTCFSNLKELFAGNAYAYSYDLAELADHYVRFRRLVDHWQELLPSRFHVVEYEALIADPLRTSEEVMRFCGLPFEPECIDITRNETPVSTASSSQVRQPINTRGMDAWRRYAEHLEPLGARIRESLASVR